MQTLVLSFDTSAAREGAREGLALSLAGRRTDIITKATVAGMEITPPTLGTDEDGLPTVTTPGTYGPTTWPLEIAIYDNDPLPDWPAGATVATATSSLAFAPVPETAPEAAQTAAVFPEKISDRQFAQGLAKAGLIAMDEAKAWVGPGTLPAAISAFITAMPEDQRDDVEIVLIGATEFKRSHPLVATFGAAVGMTSQQLDQFWIMCASL